MLDPCRSCANASAFPFAPDPNFPGGPVDIDRFVRSSGLFPTDSTEKDGIA